MPQTTEHQRLSDLVEDLKTGIDELYRASEKAAEQFDHAILEKNSLLDDYELLSENFDLQKSETNRGLAAHRQTASKEIAPTTIRETNAADSKLVTQRDQSEKLVASLTRQLSQVQSELAKAKLERDESNDRALDLSRQLSSTQQELRQTEKLLATFARDSESATEQVRRQVEEAQQAGNANPNAVNEAAAEAIRLRTVMAMKDQERLDAENKLKKALKDQVNLNQALRDELTISRTPNTVSSDESAIEQVDSTASEHRQPLLFDESPDAAKSDLGPNEPALQEIAVSDVPVKTTQKGKPKRKTPARPKDDFTLIEGIGPKIRDLLVSKRISTFQKLSNMETARLERLLEGAGLSLKRHDPSTWSEQAKLAADGNLQRLKELQKNMAKSWVGRCVRPVH